MRSHENTEDDIKPNKPATIMTCKRYSTVNNNSDCGLQREGRKMIIERGETEDREREGPSADGRRAAAARRRARKRKKWAEPLFRGDIGSGASFVIQNALQNCYSEVKL